MNPIHVMGAQTGGRRPDVDNHHCDRFDPWNPRDPASRDVETVYHEGSVHKDGHWYCACGVSTEKTYGVFVVRLLDD